MLTGARSNGLALGFLSSDPLCANVGVGTSAFCVEAGDSAGWALPCPVLLVSVVRVKLCALPGDACGSVSTALLTVPGNSALSAAKPPGSDNLICEGPSCFFPSVLLVKETLLWCGTAGRAGARLDWVRTPDLSAQAVQVRILRNGSQISRIK